jgi:2,3-bisphosphoglycerate-dependent phosphoglycerate mutase
MPTLVLLRHGQSRWNLENRFTGWVDVDLTPQGEAEAVRAGQLIGEAGIAFDRGFASVLTRAIRTAWLALAAADQAWIPLAKDWRLNVRQFGDDQVKVWRRSYDAPPPPIEAGGPYDLSGDRRYRGVTVPATESLKTTLERVLPYWNAEMAPALAAGDCVLAAAHGNSLRAIVKHLFDVDEAAIVQLEIPTGNPLVVELGADLRPRSARYLDAARAQPLPAVRT